ncbi:hypothetical protein LTR37_016301 [Vermiconidia calcicola]|uniref:Uncharacterized protein n=1 Tax=Vermiconidia calcicola TaxID=1690605 RepID=A0ACC3MPX1_9PEZI|nr:hypothetical protein LTR37_016301 [Vermiconidia calcicola]
MATLEPRSPYSPEELEKLYPKNLELQQVQILLRHGERTPVNARFKNAGLPPYWPYCSPATAMSSTVLQADGTRDTLQWKRRLQAPGEGDAPTLLAGSKGEIDAVCQPGELTDRGRETTLALGQRIRKLYVEQLGFLPSTIDQSSASGVYLRATPIQRALESVQQAFVGLYPPSARAAGVPPPTIVTRSAMDETLFPNESACKRFRELAHEFAERTAKLYNDGPELAYINKKIGKWMPEDSPVVKVDSHPRLSGVMDSVNASSAHGSATRLPSEFYDKKVRADIDKVCTEEWFSGYQESNEYRKLGIGALVGDLTQRMVEHAIESKIGDEDAFKISLAGCHDTTIAAALTSLGAMDATKDKWPNFTSNIAFELFKRRDAASSSSPNGAMWPSKEKTWWFSLFSSPRPSQPASARTPLSQWPNGEKSKLDEYYVRLRYNDNIVTVPYCRPVGRNFDGDETFCTLSAFKEAADSFTPKNWKAECRMNLGLPVISGHAEPPPGL